MEGMTPLHLAAQYSHFGVVEFLFRREAQLEIPCNEGRTALHYASASGSPEIVRLLLSAGAKAKAQAPGDYRRPIHIAAAKGSVQVIGILKKAGVSLSARDCC